jgi:hypothetical protein
VLVSVREDRFILHGIDLDSPALHIHNTLDNTYLDDAYVEQEERQRQALKCDLQTHWTSENPSGKD